MTDLGNRLILYVQYPFVRYALIAGVMIALCASVLGVVLVLKRFSLIGDGLSHVAFGAMAVSAVLGLTDDLPLTLLITLLCAVALLRGGRKGRIGGDAAVAMLSVGSLAVGYLIMNLFSTSANLSGDVCSTLFGSTSILTLRSTDIWLCVGLSAVVLAVFGLCLHRIFAVTFDEEFAEVSGLGTRRLQLLLAVLIAVVIVLAMRLVGSLLISALVIFPALSAMQVLKSFRGVTICAGAVGVFCAVLGILAAILAGTPVGATIVSVNIGVFCLFFLAGKGLGRCGG